VFEFEFLFGEAEGTQCVGLLLGTGGSADGDRLRKLREQSAIQEEKLNAILDEKRRLDTLRLSEGEVLAALTDFDPL
jgi:hypothetical protein